MSETQSPAPVDPSRAAAPFRWHWLLGGGIALGGAVILLVAAYQGWVGNDARVSGALLGGMMAATATALGTVPVLLSQQFSQRTYDTLLGFGAGVMLAASSFSLVIPALAAAKVQGAGPWGAGTIVGIGILLGAAFLLAIDRAVPHEHFIKGVEGPQAKALKRVWLFVPEGMVVALALRSVGYSRGLSAGLGVLSGLVEPVAAVLGVLVISLSVSLLPWGLAIAAGAMLFVISHEIIPESHRQGHEAWATAGLMVGFVIMMLLDTALG